MSMNIWTLDLALRKAEEIFEAPIPFEESWSDGKKGAMLARYALLFVIPDVLALSNTAVVRDDASRAAASVEFVERWLEARWKPLLKAKATGVVEHPLNPAGAPSGFKSGSMCDATHSAGAVGNLLRPFKTSSKRMASMFKPLSVPARELFLQDWLEEAIAFVVGERFVVPFAANCLLAPPGKSSAVNKLHHASWLKP